MRDLKADLEQWNKYFMNNYCSDNTVQMWISDVLPEAINRTIAAEETLANKAADEMPHSFVNMKWACGHEGGATCQQCNAALREENEDLSAQVVAYREALEEVTEELENCYGRDTELTIKAREIINSPSPGAKIKAVVEAAWELVDCETRTYSRSKYVHKLKRALAELEGGTSND